MDVALLALASTETPSNGAPTEDLYRWKSATRPNADTMK